MVGPVVRFSFSTMYLQMISTSSRVGTMMVIPSLCW